jgi:hypothetical protein
MPGTAWEELDRADLEEHPEVRQRMWEQWHGYEPSSLLPLVVQTNSRGLTTKLGVAGHVRTSGSWAWRL